MLDVNANYVDIGRRHIEVSSNPNQKDNYDHTKRMGHHKE